MVSVFIQGDLVDGRELVSAGEGFAVLESDFNEIIQGVSEVITLYSPGKIGGPSSFTEACTQLAQRLKHSFFPCDTFAYGNFRESDKFDFQLMRLESIRGNVNQNLSAKSCLYLTNCCLCRSRSAHRGESSPYPSVFENPGRGTFQRMLGSSR
jgi:hypothetical protein